MSKIYVVVREEEVDFGDQYHTTESLQKELGAFLTEEAAQTRIQELIASEKEARKKHYEIYRARQQDRYETAEKVNGILAKHGHGPVMHASAPVSFEEWYKDAWYYDETAYEIVELDMNE